MVPRVTMRQESVSVHQDTQELSAGSGAPPAAMDRSVSSVAPVRMEAHVTTLPETVRALLVGRVRFALSPALWANMASTAAKTVRVAMADYVTMSLEGATVQLDSVDADVKRTVLWEPTVHSATTGVSARMVQSVTTSTELVCVKQALKALIVKRDSALRAFTASSVTSTALVIPPTPSAAIHYLVNAHAPQDGQGFTAMRPALLDTTEKDALCPVAAPMELTVILSQGSVPAPLASW
ncbi:hypothetical protein AMECASPLE_014143 [Ameca splendens]|uniref:Uncharacterized protein n=1 Tax=Ameca splendens TaxID=208324 RepID=A0ABV0YCR5_9TELE